MTIHASGSPIYMSEINTELGKAATAGITLNDSNVRVLLGRPTAATSIDLAMAYSKSDRTAISLYATNVNDYNVWNNRGGTYRAGKSDITLTVTGTVSASSTGVYALDTGTGWTSGDTITIVNNGTIIGATGATGAYGTGGAGGRGRPIATGSATAGNPGSAGGAGGTGGPSLFAQWPIRMYNNGSIYGGNGGAGGLGGGGGGGGGDKRSYYCAANSTTYLGSGGNGGTGQGPSAATAGSAGSGSTSGACGVIHGYSGGSGGAYGNSGAVGLGTSGAAGGAAGPTGSAGARGAYVVGYGNVTWVVAGTLAGSAS